MKNNLHKILMEQINALLNEEKILVDNFQKIGDMLYFTSDDDFYFVQIIKRLKDNADGDRSIGDYYSRCWYLKSYRIHSLNELFSLKDEIISICNENNARAYITLNSRSEKGTEDFIKIYRSKFPETDARYKYADQIVPGQAKYGHNWKNKRLRLFLDIDVSKNATCGGKNIWEEVRKIIRNSGIVPLGEYVTPKGGLHIILPDKNDRQINHIERLFTKFDNWINKGRNATVHMNKDGKIILYSNTETKTY